MKHYLYTDGACQPNPGSGGWSFIAFTDEDTEQHRQSGYEQSSTNNRMELTSVLKGMLYIRSIDDNPDILLYSDSKYMLNGLETWMHNWVQNDWKKKNNKLVVNDDIWRQLYSVCQGIIISYQHIKGHSGHPENEECDRLAVKQIKDNAKT